MLLDCAGTEVLLAHLTHGTVRVNPGELWHGLFNTLVASEAAQGLIAAVMTTGIMILAVFALVVAGPRELRGLSRNAGLRQQHRTRATSKREPEAA